MISDQMAYLVVMPHASGAYAPEQSVSDMTRKRVVASIISGEWRREPVQVLEFNPIEGTCRDVTEDIARDVRDAMSAERLPVSHDMNEWLTAVIGVDTTNEMEVA